MSRSRRRRRQQFGFSVESLERRELFSAYPLVSEFCPPNSPLTADALEGGPEPTACVETFDASLGVSDLVPEAPSRALTPRLGHSIANWNLLAPLLVDNDNAEDAVPADTSIGSVVDDFANTQFAFSDRTGGITQPLRFGFQESIQGLSNAEDVGWWGHCNGWASAAIMEKEPTRATSNIDRELLVTVLNGD